MKPESLKLDLMRKFTEKRKYAKRQDAKMNEKPNQML